MSHRRKSFVRFTRALIVFWVVFFVIFGIIPLPQNNIIPEPKIAKAAAGDGFILYDQTTPSTNVQERAYTASSDAIGGASSPFAGSGTSKFFQAAGTSVRDEMLLGIQDSAGTLTIYKKTFAGSWTSQWTATVGDGNLRRFDIAYEQSSGDALVVFSGNTTTNGQELKYYTWNGSSWTGPTNLDTVRTTATVIHGVRLASRPSSDEIGLVWEDSAFDISANLWTGSAWFGEPSAALSTNGSKIGTATAPTNRNYDLAFESTSGDLLVVWGEDAVLDPKYVIKTAGGAWGAVQAPTAFNEEGTMIDIASSPISDKIAYVNCTDNGGDCDFAVWSGSAWGTVLNDATSGTPVAGDSGNNVEFLADGANEVAIMTYNDSAAGGLDWVTSTNGGNPASQTDNTTAPAIAGAERAGISKLVPGSNNKAIFAFEDANADIFTKIATLSGTTVTWSNPSGISAAIETAASVTGFQPVTIAYSRYTPPTTTLGDGTDGGNSTIGPGDSATEIDRFSLVTSAGTDTVTGMTVTLAGNASAYTNIATVDVQTTGGVSQCSSSSWGADNLVELSSCAISVTTGSTEYKVLITPKTHANMPAVPGASYATTATVTSITATNSTAGTDTDSATITVDNASPNNATSTSATSGNAAITVNWTTSSGETTDAVLLRWASTTAGSDVPVEGTSYSVGNTIGTATVACVITGQTTATALSKIDGSGGSSGCNTVALTNGTAYSYKVFHKDSRGNYDAGVSTNLTNITPNIVTTASTTGSQEVNLSKNTTNQYVGGAFTFSATGSVNVTGITITESGTIDALNHLDNIKLYYESDISNPYNCASESYAGTESQFGTTDTDGFSAANGTSAFTGSVALTTTSTMCVYVVFDITSAATGGQTIEISIASTNDYTTSTGTKSGTPSIAGTTTLYNMILIGDGTDPGNSTVAPGSSITDIDAFTVAMDNGTASLIQLLVFLPVANSYENIAEARITSDDGTTLYFTAISNPSSDTLNFSGGTSISATTTPTQYKVRITPKTHANMPAVPGASYATTATVTSIFSSASSETVADTDSATITIDNLSPNAATSTSGSTGDGYVSLNWTTSNSADFSRTMILRWAAATPGAEVPVEGTDYTAGDAITTATVACVFTGDAASTAKSNIIDGSGGNANCTNVALTNGQAYSYVVFQKDSNGNYDVGVTFTGSPFTPAGTGITISGTAYQTNGSTNLGTGKRIALRINGTLAGTGDAGTGLDDTNASGQWSFSSVSAGVGDTVTLYITNGAAEKGNTITITDGSTNITSTPIYDDHVIIRSDRGATAITIVDLIDYDNDQNATDMLFDAEDAAPDTLIVEDGVKLFIHTGDTFTPGGNVTTDPSSSAASVDGDLEIDGTGTLSMGTNSLSVGGDYLNEGTFSKSTGQTTTFTATATGHSITDGGENFDALVFNGSGGGWSFADSTTIDVSLTMTAGTLSGTNDITVTTDVVGTAGVITLTGGTFEQRVGTSEDFGPSTTNTDWTFNNLTFSRSAGTPTVTKQSCATCDITVTGVLAISKAADGAGITLNAGDATWTLSNSNSANPLDNDGQGADAGTLSGSSTFVYSGDNDAGDVNLENVAYNNLTLGGSVAENYTPVATTSVGGNLVMNSNGTLNGSQSVTVTGTATGDGTINVSSGTFTVNGSGNFGGNTGWSFNNLTIGGAATANGSGAVTLAGVLTINGASSLNAGSKTWTLNKSGTAGSRPFVNSGSFTASSSTFDYEGTAATDIETTNATYTNLKAGATQDGGAGVTYTLNGSTTVSAVLTVGHASSTNADTLALGATTLTLSGGGTPLALAGSSKALVSQGTSIVQYTGDGATVAATTFANLTLGTGSTIGLTMPASAMSISGNLIIGNNATITKGSGTITFNAGGAQTWTDNNATSQDMGAIATSGASTSISTGSNVRLTSLDIAGSTTFNISNDTLTITGNGTPLTAGGTFTTTGSTVAYTNATSATVTATTFNNLTLGVAAGSATYTMPASTTTLRGNLVITSGNSVTKGAGTVVFAIGGGSTQTWTDNTASKQDLGAVQISANSGVTTLNAGSDLKATSVTIDGSQIFDLAGGARTLTLTSNSTPLSISGTLTDTDDTIAFVPGSSGTITVPTRTYNNVSLNGSGSTFRPGAGTLNFGGTLTITNGTLDLNTSDPTTTVTGVLTNAGTLDAPSANSLTFNNTFTNNGTFNANSGTVIANPTGSTATINGSTATTNFHSFTMANQSGKTLSFKAGNTYGFAGTLTLSGGQSVLDVQSNSAGSQWFITFTGTAAISNIKVKDGGCTASNNIPTVESVLNNGNNGTCWGFIRRGGTGGGDGSGGGTGQTGGGSGSGGGGDGSGGGGGTLPQAFTAADTTVLTTYDSNWNILAGGANAFLINTNAVHSNAAGDTMARWIAGSFNDNQYAELTITASATGYIGVGVRLQAGAHTGYGVYCNATDIKVIEWAAGTPTTHYTGSACTANDVVRLEISGTTLTLKKNGSVVTTVSDSTLTTGRPGLVGNGQQTTTRGDNFYADSVLSGGGGGGGGGGP